MADRACIKSRFVIRVVALARSAGVSALLCLLVNAAAMGADLARFPIRELPSGSWVEVAEAIQIPANRWDIPLGGNTDLRCKLRMQQAKPFARVLPRGARLRVEGVRQAGFTARRQISLFSYIELASPSIEDVSCSGAVDATVHDLQRALDPRLRVRLAEQAGQAAVVIR